MNTALKCLECGEIFFTEDTVSVGGLPRCSECGGALTIPGILEIACCNCDFTQSVSGINVNECSACPKCGWALDVVSQNLEAKVTPEINDTIQKEADLIKENSNETIALAPPQIEQSEDVNIAMNAPSLKASGDGIEPAPQNPPEDELYPDDSIPPSADTIIADRKSPPTVPEQTTGIAKGSFGKYEIIEELARGGMGIVYRVMDPDLNRELALKVLIAGEGASEDLLKRFMREARAAAQINHPNVVPIHEVGNIKGQYYFTMDLIEGTSFDKIIESKWMPIEEMVTHIRDIALALKRAHDMNIIHRDIKPANIMFDVKNERALLTDFGLAKDLDSNTMLSMTGMMMGSPAYMSPEQARGMIHNIDPRSDIYSLGVVLFEAATGEQPFIAETIVEVVQKVVNDDPISPRKIEPEKVSNDLQNIILKCMEKEPEKRYQNMQELINDLNAYLEGRKVTAKPPSAMAMRWRKLKKSPLMLSIVIGSPFAAALILFLGWYIFLAPKPLDLAEEAITSTDAKRQEGAIHDIASWIQSGRFSEPDERSKIITLLSSCLQKKSQSVAVQACLALEKLGDPQAIPPLLALLTEDNRSDKLKIAAIAALRVLATKKKSDKESINSALKEIALNKAMSNSLRIVAINAAVESWGAGTMKAMLKIAKDKDEKLNLRVAAIHSIETKLTLGSPSMYEIIRLSSNKNPKIREAAEAALKNSRSHSSILGLYGIKNSASIVNKQLIGVLQANARHQQELMDMMTEKEEPEEKTPLEIISSKLKDKNPDTRLAAVYDLGKLGDGKAVPILVNSLTDTDPDVVSVAAESIIKLSPKQKPDMKKIIELLKNPTPVIREQAIYIIGKSGDPEALQMVIILAEKENNMLVITIIADVLKNAEAKEALPTLDKLLAKSSNKNNEASLACISAMQTFGKASAKYLIKYISSPNQNIKNAAIKALSDISGRNYGSDIKKWEKWAK